MQRLMEILRSMMASFRMVLKPVMIAGQWTQTLVREAVKEVAGPLNWMADRAVDVVDATLSLPGAVLAGLAQARGGKANKSAEAEVQTDEQVRKAQAANEAALTAGQTARILQRACKWRAEGRDAGDLVEALPENLRTYAERLTIAECIRMGETEPKVVIEWLSGNRGPLPGIRTPEEVLCGDAKPKATAPAPGNGSTVSEQQVLDTLAARLRARTRNQDDDEENVVPMRRSM